MLNYEIKNNEQFGSVEVYFHEIPSAAIRDLLKSNSFRWHTVKKCWYGYKTAEAVTELLKGGSAATEPKEPKKVINEYGLKVGDVLKMSWGYDQTNNDFFQVLEVSAKKVRVVEVAPDYSVEWSSGMAEDRTLSYKEGELLPIMGRSIWIKDQEKGDWKSIWKYSDKEHPSVVIESRGCYHAHKTTTGTTFYESWYA